MILKKKNKKRTKSLKQILGMKIIPIKKLKISKNKKS